MPDYSTGLQTADAGFSSHDKAGQCVATVRTRVWAAYSLCCWPVCCRLAWQGLRTGLAAELWRSGCSSRPASCATLLLGCLLLAAEPAEPQIWLAGVSNIRAWRRDRCTPVRTSLLCINRHAT